MKKLTVEEKRQDEQKTVALMIQLYCKKKHGQKKAMKNPDFMCADCKDLLSYVNERILHCPFMETKTFCSNCRVHCYKKDYREKIRLVMRFSGPLMLFYHPVKAIKHVTSTIKEKRRLSKEDLNLAHGTSR